METTFSSKEQLVLARLEKFYSQPGVLDRVKNIIGGNSKISLRLIDWLVTNYAKKKDIYYKTKDGRDVVVYLSYKSRLRAYNKKMFDPFCRWDRIKFQDMDTTVGQLSFFEWAIQDEVLDYLETNYDIVHADMEQSTQTISNKHMDGRKKRHELSKSATKSITYHDVRTVVKFN